MPKDDMHSTDYGEIELSQYDKQLLQRQSQLQTESQQVLADLKVIDLLSRVGRVRQTGSTTVGLMVWRDIDLQVYSPGLSAEQAFATMQPLLTHPYVTQVRYLHQSDHFKIEDLGERYFFMVMYQYNQIAEWKLDISFWIEPGIRPEPVQDELEQVLTAETRLLILRIKDAWYQLPAYRVTVASTDIYDAVLHHGVRTLDDFDHYLVQRGKPTRAEQHDEVHRD
ncbi:hypothetical protein [Dictyobacter aurantiacus]|uniref:Polymerase nucleotidyl transferase domain-containing protein n=1 Tax=Dictyobacter aurantiacus TaxID=1936993 RepID=A0A401ZSJ7_9CHLR|nr:hypothetical protein [Dictyobacter aurantiacus]GCE09833.1 hypothetical protein KDAU_71620 [Dictyobacter aurantiacus]